MAGLLAPFNFDVFQDASLIQLVDNQSALSCFISGSSPKADTSIIVSVFTILMGKKGARYWGEFVESEANVSDGVSRDGIQDKSALLLGCDIIQCNLPPLGQFANASLEALMEAFEKTG